jgi:hypothetical protein
MRLRLLYNTICTGLIGTRSALTEIIAETLDLSYKEKNY